MKPAVPAIDVKDLFFSYGTQQVLDHVTFKVSRGDFLGIIGPNGGGKTTLLRCMLGLLSPDSGTVLLDGVPSHERRSAVGYIPQETGMNKTFPVSTLDVVLMGLSGKRGLFKRVTKDDRRKAHALLERLGLAECRARPIAELSGGQRQKVLLARAMVAEPSMLFLDEPTASVDTTGEEDIYRYLKERNEEGVTVVLVTHNTGAISRYVKSVACVNRELFFHPDGKIGLATVRKTFGCEVDLIAHGVPHRVFHDHTAGEPDE